MVEYVKKVDNDDKLYCDIWYQNMITNPDQDYQVIKARLKTMIKELLKEKEN